ncbi:MAG TPA: lysyl oxidase family protein [Phycisphaerales bacterium]|nr:lysyl oxidase family protein [Phycisphaerales bacterium]
MGIRTPRRVVIPSALGLLSGLAAAQQNLYPDIIVRQSDLYDNIVVVEGNLRWLRMSNGTPNIGDGKLYLYGVFPPNDDGTQTVRQRIYRDDGTWWDTDAGHFIHHQGHNHIHFEDWAMYRLRERLDDGGVGAVIAEGDKTSFCILDLGIYDRSLPNFDPDGQFHSCDSTVQGLSVGWLDVYGKHLNGQQIDITGVPNGVYWLESEVDPLNRVIEKDESNNIERVLVTIGGDGPDLMEPNNSRGQVLARPEGGWNSPNLGPCAPERIVPTLSIHDSADRDYFRFYVNHTAGASDFVRIDFAHAEGDLALELHDSNGNLMATSQTAQDFERISLEGRAEGWYYARVYGVSGATTTDYALTVNPPQNQAPSVEVLTPPPGDTVLEHGVDTYNIEWEASDPESDATWVTIYLNHHPELDDHAIMLPASLNTPGGEGFFVVNSADVPPGTYWAIAEITDGGTVTHGVSAGTVSFVELCTGDFNRDGSRNTIDVLDFLNAWNAGDAEADYNHDGLLDTTDVLAFLNAWNGPC